MQSLRRVAVATLAFSMLLTACSGSDDGASTDSAADASTSAEGETAESLARTLLTWAAESTQVDGQEAADVIATAY